ncbi:Pre-mRNA-splicing factor SYF2 [Clarireedia jacksonii]
MPPAKKRKTRATAEISEEVQPVASIPEPAQEKPKETKNTDEPTKVEPAAESSSESTSSDAAARAKERQERFKQLQARAKKSAQTNLKEAALESQRLATDPNLLASLNRKSAIASHNLLKADAEARGEDFERKRAWDWTIDESEKWDQRMEEKQAHRDNQAFQDYRQDSQRVYERQVRNLKPDMEQYEKEKMAAVEKAAASGGLDIVETADGELIAVDKDGTFYSTADSTGFVEHRPDKANIDRLVKDLQQAEEVRLRKRKERMNAGDEGDVTYINDKNKQFNQKLSRFYNKYTAEIRDSFERGTMI